MGNWFHVSVLKSSFIPITYENINSIIIVTKGRYKLQASYNAVSQPFKRHYPFIYNEYLIII